MLKKCAEILGYTLRTQNGDIGQCQNLLFDDQNWVIRYFVTKINKSSSPSKVLISPVFLAQPNWVEQVLPVRLSHQQIEDAPTLDEHAPVSREYEKTYHRYHTMPYYWIGYDIWGHYSHPARVTLSGPDQLEIDFDKKIEDQAEHLHAVTDVWGYQIAAHDGPIGIVEDFIVDHKTWAIRYLVIDLIEQQPGRKVLAAPPWLQSVDWLNQEVHIDLNIEAITSSPAYDPNHALNRRFETKLHNHYDQRYYWE